MGKIIWESSWSTPVPLASTRSTSTVSGSCSSSGTGRRPSSQGRFPSPPGRVCATTSSRRRVGRSSWRKRGSPVPQNRLVGSCVSRTRPPPGHRAMVACACIARAAAASRLQSTSFGWRAFPERHFILHPLLYRSRRYITGLMIGHKLITLEQGPPRHALLARHSFRPILLSLPSCCALLSRYDVLNLLSVWLLEYSVPLPSVP